MYTVSVRVEMATSDHLRSLRDALGLQEFKRQYPGIDDIWDGEVSMSSETEDGWKVVFSRATNAVIPPKSTTRAIEQLRESNERLAAENRALQQDLSDANGRSARLATIVGAIVGLLGILASILSALFL